MEPKVNLISFTKDAVPLMCYMRRIMHSPIPDSLAGLKDNPKKWLGCSIDEYFNTVLLKDHMPTFLESVNMFFKIDNISREATHQLVRHRIGFSFAQQSLRCVKLERFAEDEKYRKPENYDAVFHSYMLSLQGVYDQAISDGICTQDARALLPMGIQTSISFSCNLRALMGMVNKRLCYKTQPEMHKIALQIREKVIFKIDNRLRKFMDMPCAFGKCMMESECEQQFKEGKLTGKQNTDHCCPIYIKKFKGGKK